VWNHGESIEAYDRAFELDKNNATLHQQRGHRYLSIRQFDKARLDLEKAVAMDAKLAGAWYYLGVLDYVAGRFSKAAADFEKNLALQGDDIAKGIGTVDWLYMSYRRATQDEKAKQLLARVTPDLKIEGNPRLYFNRTLFYKGLKKEAELLAGTPSDIELTTLCYGIGNFHLVNGDKQKAREYMEKAVGTTAWVGLGKGGERVIAVPTAALQRLEDAWVVFVPKGTDTFEVRPVGRGRDLGGEVEIVSGLRPGERVVVEGAFLLKAEAEKLKGEGKEHAH